MHVREGAADGAEVLQGPQGWRGERGAGQSVVMFLE